MAKILINLKKKLAMKGQLTMIWKSTYFQSLYIFIGFIVEVIVGSFVMESSVLSSYRVPPWNYKNLHVI